MPRNGTGGYSLPNNGWNPAINGTAATAADWQQIANDIATAIQQSVSSDGQTAMTGSLKMGGYVVTGLGAPTGDGQSLRWQQLTKGADIASAATITVPVEGSVFNITGTSTISAINDVYPGRIAYFIFGGVLTLTNSSSLVLPGGVNITTKANDVMAFLNESPGIWRCIAYPNRVGVQAGEIPTSTFKNKLINGNPLINQRQVSGTVSLTAGKYGHDRWKAGAGGCTYTFSTSNNVVTINISAGTLVQVIEGASFMSGSHTLSWTGTAQGRINAAAFSASPAVATLTGGTNALVEFSTGTFAMAQLEAGSNATPFDVRPIGIETTLCQRYYRLLGVGTPAYAISTTSIYVNSPNAIVMRATPARTIAPTAFVDFTTGTSFPAASPTGGGLSLADVDGGFYMGITGFTGLTAGRVGALNTYASIRLDAEL